jgi:hypothetical protein
MGSVAGFIHGGVRSERRGLSRETVAYTESPPSRHGCTSLIRGSEPNLPLGACVGFDFDSAPPGNQITMRVTPASVSKSRASRAMSRYWIGSRSLTIHCSRAFPSVIFKTCKASPMPHIQQVRNI